MIPATTRAAVLYRLKEPLVVEDLFLPPLQEGQVLVRVAYAGLCSTQLLEVNGDKGEDRFLPHTLGHEASGTAIAVGPGVTRVKEGDALVLSWIKGQGINASAPKYQNSKGQTVNAGQVATFSQYAVVSENRCTVIPSDFSLKSAALLGCAVPTGAGIVLNEVKPKPGESVAILGVGGVGLSALLSARLMHCNPIIAVDVQDRKLEFAKTLGATHTLNLATIEKSDALARVRSWVKGGVDYSVECSGAKSAMEFGFQMVKEKGGKCVIAGNLPHGNTIQIDPFDLIKGREILGTVGGGSCPEHDIPLYVWLNQSGQFDLDRLIAKIYTLDDINEAIKDLSNGVLGRILLRFE